VADEKLEETLTLRLSSAEMRLLRRISGPISRSHVAREALKIGLDYFAKNPQALLKLPPRPTGPKPRRRPRGG
jgi:hypothetical protein